MKIKEFKIVIYILLIFPIIIFVSNLPFYFERNTELFVFNLLMSFLSSLAFIVIYFRLYTIPKIQNAIIYVVLLIITAMVMYLIMPKYYFWSRSTKVKGNKVTGEIISE